MPDCNKKNSFNLIMILLILYDVEGGVFQCAPFLHVFLGLVHDVVT